MNRRAFLKTTVVGLGAMAAGPIAFAAVTKQPIKTSAIDRIYDRRIIIQIDKTVKAIADFNVVWYDVNDEYTRFKMKDMLEEYLIMLQDRKAIRKYNVICDETNNTPLIIDRNEFVIDVGVQTRKDGNTYNLEFTLAPEGFESVDVLAES